MLIRTFRLLLLPPRHRRACCSFLLRSARFEILVLAVVLAVLLLLLAIGKDGDAVVGADREAPIAAVAVGNPCVTTRSAREPAAEAEAVRVASLAEGGAPPPTAHEGTNKEEEEKLSSHVKLVDGDKEKMYELQSNDKVDVSEQERRMVHEKVLSQLSGALNHSRSSQRSWDFFSALDRLGYEGEGALKILVAASWRTGSSFLGEMLARIPGTFYNFEPLMDKVLVNSKADQVEVLKSVFRCNYSYHSYPPDFRWTFLHNRWYHAACAAHPTNREKVALCADRRLMGASCRLATVRLAKTVRLSVDRAAELLRDLPGLKIVALFRDPRPTLLSRAGMDWCVQDRCLDVATVCTKMRHDLDAAVALKVASKSNSVLIIRYEDLSSSPQQAAREVFDFLDLPIPDPVSKFLTTHTRTRVNARRLHSVMPLERQKQPAWQQNPNNPYSTYRNSRNQFHKSSMPVQPS